VKPVATEKENRRGRKESWSNFVRAVEWRGKRGVKEKVGKELI
jgi:hypothetical protein